MITVKQLKEALKDVDENLPVVVTGGRDHSLLEVTSAYSYFAGYFPEYQHWGEYYDDVSLSEGEEKREAFVVDVQ